MLIYFAGPSVNAWADDSAASFAAGGLVARQENRIVMAREVLRIGLSKVEVDYDFRNDTDEDVTTEVAFPEPPFGQSVAPGDPDKADFSDFMLEINGKPAAYDGKSLCEFGDVVVVSVNHRLNILGTLDLSAYGPEYANSRNTGMADLLAAVQWVHDNIEAFGGDPGNVTLFGQSGGGGKVTRMMNIPAAKGLFHKVICQSGAVSNYRDSDMEKIIEKQKALAAETLKILNIDGSEIDKLKQVPYRTLLEAGNKAIKNIGGGNGEDGPGWNPVADDKFVMREFCDWAAPIPYISGTVMTEHNTNLEHGEFTKNEWSAQEVDDRLTKTFGANKDLVISEFKKLHPTKKIQDALYLETGFRPRSKLILSRKLEKATAPVYHYMFTYEFPVNGGITAFHCGDIAFAFHALAEPHMHVATGGAPEAVSLQNKLSQAWVNFAHTGNPSQPGLVWKPYTLAGREMMEWDSVPAMRSFNDDVLLPLLPRQRRG